MRAAHFVCFASLIAGCGVPAAPSSPEESAVTAAPSKKTAPHSLAGDYTLPQPATACGGEFNVDDDTKVEATASELTITQNIYGTYDVFFTAKVGDIIDRPSAEIVALGYTTVDRQISSYSENGTVFNFAHYQYDMSLTDAEGLAQGPFETVQIKSDGKGGILFDHGFSGEDPDLCHFVAYLK